MKVNTGKGYGKGQPRSWICSPAEFCSHASLRMLAADSLIWKECLENKAGFVLFYCRQLNSLTWYLSSRGYTEVSLRCVRETEKRQQFVGLSIPKTAHFTGLNATCLHCNLIKSANWIKLFRLYLFTAIVMYIHRASPLWVVFNERHFLAFFRQAGIRLSMSLLRVHMIMVDCLQVFSDLLPMPGHGGGTASPNFTHLCGGPALEWAGANVLLLSRWNIQMWGNIGFALRC